MRRHAPLQAWTRSARSSAPGHRPGCGTVWARIWLCITALLGDWSGWVGLGKVGGGGWLYWGHPANTLGVRHPRRVTVCDRVCGRVSTADLWASAPHHLVVGVCG